MCRTKVSHFVIVFHRLNVLDVTIYNGRGAGLFVSMYIGPTIESLLSVCHPRKTQLIKTYSIIINRTTVFRKSVPTHIPSFSIFRT